ncbi:MAG: fliF [Candidatus Midichloriaceae bacterium]|jgi:flagellar M-ring protein FliF|nr:fliF [Candidatus Midichloriaceae bacterium]
MDFFKKAIPPKLLLAGLGVLFTIALLVVLSMKLTAPPMSLLYTNLSANDAALVASRLEGLGEPYQTANDGKDILVISSRALNLRMTFAQEGIPSSGNIVGYEIFDKNDSLGTSQFIYNVNLVRALEGEIARTISSLNSIESARVHIVIPKKELFSKATSDTSASVVLKIKGSQQLSKNEVAAISHLISTAVPGLRVENITILDNHGRPLKLAVSEDSAAIITDNAAEFQKNVEEKYRIMLEELIEKSVGIGKVKANVMADINFDREVINSEIYDPEGQVVRSRKVSEETDQEQEGSSELSVATNIPNAPTTGSGVTGAKSNKNRTDEVTNYEISKTVTNKISESGRVKRISVAILIDGLYIEKLSEDGRSKTFVYTPRSEVELEKIRLLAVSAIGLDLKRGDKIEVINMKFSDDFSPQPEVEGQFSWIKSDLDHIIQTVVIGIVIVLVVLLVIRPIIIKALDNRRVAAEELAVQTLLMSNNPLSGESSAGGTQGNSSSSTPANGLDINKEEDTEISKNFADSPNSRKKASLAKYINELVEQHPEETIAVIRNWIGTNS